jgi:hypothetical protein
MAPVVYPPRSRQTFTIKGEGTFTLNEAQLKARSLVIKVEKVKTGFIYDYYNFSTPEPNTHGGYLQLMAKDFVIETQQLEYRRQVVKFWDHINLDPIEQLRCMVRKSTQLLFDLAADGFGSIPVTGLEALARWTQYRVEVDTPRLIPEQLLSSVWYKIDIGRSVFVTIEWESYAPTLCGFPEPQLAPSGTPPGKGESGPGTGGSGDDGGGTRPANPPPPDQQGDPGSDSPGPTPGNNVPPSPGEVPPFVPPPRGIYRVTTKSQGFISSRAPCIEGPSYLNEDIVNPGPALLEKKPGREGGYAWGLYDADANFIRNIAGSSATAECEIIVTIVSQVRIDV